MAKLDRGVLIGLSAWMLACPTTPDWAAVSREGSDSRTALPSQEALERQEDRVEELRGTLGTGDPQYLVALAQLIRLRTARGDLTSGAPLFDHLLDFDLRTSPILVYGKPPIEVVRALGSLGELMAARELLEAALKRSSDLGVKHWIGGSTFELEVYRALARLKVALEEPGSVVRLQEVEARWTETGADTASAQAIRRNRPLYSEREKTAPGARPDLRFRPYPEGASWSEVPGGHEHFDSMLEIAPKAAFETAERLRATALIDLSLLTRIRRLGSAAEEPRPELRRSRLEGLEHPPRSGPPPAGPELAKISSALQAVTRALDRIASTDSRFETLRTERARLQGQRTQHLNDTWRSVEEFYIPTTSADFQKILDPGTVMLYYMVAADHTDLLVLVKGSEVAHHRIAMGSEQLEEAVTQLLAASRRQPARGATLLTDSHESGGVDREAVALRLFEALMAPAGREIEAGERLLIVPDGPLHRLPFGALRRRADAERQQYVLEWKPIHLAPSAATYAALLENRREKLENRGSLMAFGDPAYDRSAAGVERSLPYAVRSAAASGFSGLLEPLPGSVREVEQIGKLFDAQGRKKRILLGRDAEEGLAKKARQAAFLHFAVHGLVDGEQPEHSFLALSLPEALAEGEENGVLEGWEIEDEMRLEAELVTLSACETALGKERSGEGPASLSRAFLGAGARSVLAALWKVDDAATAELMTRFYRHLLDGRSKDEALRSAQLQLLRGAEGEHRAPSYWAGFQLTGDWR